MTQLRLAIFCLLSLPTIASAQPIGSSPFSFPFRLFGIGNQGASLAVGDLDGDLDMDVVTVGGGLGGSGVNVLIRNADGSFESFVQISVGASLSNKNVVLGDLDGDKDLDIVVAAGSFFAVLLNNGDGSFADPDKFLVGSGANWVAIGDLDGDLDLDVVTANQFENIDGNLSVMLNDGNGVFTDRVDFIAGDGPRCVAIGDLDGDLDLDLAVANEWSDDVSVLFNNGDATFSLSENSYDVAEEPQFLVLADMDGDMVNDIVVASNVGDEIATLSNAGDGTFAESFVYQTVAGSRTFAVGDLDGDLDNDLVVSVDERQILLNTGNGTLELASSFGSPLAHFVTVDMDHDSDLDLVGVDGSGDVRAVSIIYNRGDANFDANHVYGTPESPRWIANGDLDGDFDEDLIVPHDFGVTVLMNSGDGIFVTDTTYDTTEFRPNHVAIADLDGDFDLDFTVVDGESGNLLVFLNNGDGTFLDEVTYAAGEFPIRVAIGDLDGDQDADLVVANFSQEFSILMNNGNGTFAARVSYELDRRPRSVAVADLDGDQDLDISLVDDVSVIVRLNNGDGTFPSGTSYQTGYDPMFVAVGDLDNDQDLDLCTANDFSDNISILFNNGDGTFQTGESYPVGEVPQSLVFGDLDGDSDQDLIVASQGEFAVMLNNGDGTFVSEGRYSIYTTPSGIVFADLDGDMDLDLAFAHGARDRVSIVPNRGTAVLGVNADGYNALRGAFVSGDLSDVQESDDSYLKYNAGLTLNPTEPPVWIEFEGTLPTDSPTSLSVTLEASVSTPNLGQTIEAFNWLTGQYEEVDFQPASSGNDLVVTIDLTADIGNYVQSGTGAVKIQAKWKYTGGLILGFPWRVSIDQVVWTVTE